MKKLNDIKDFDISQINGKVTLIKFSDFGYPIAIKLNITNAFVRNYAQYNNCIQVEGKPPRKRKARAYIIKPYEEIAIFEGFVDLQQTEKVEFEGNVKITSLGTCFDRNTLRKSINNIQANRIL